jgi:succinyl-CoA synthetase beta subunit
MKLDEHYGKRLLAKYGVPVPQGYTATNPQEVHAIAERIGTAVVVKAQVLVGGRGKAGGVKMAKDANEAEAAAEKIIGMEIKGLKVEKVLVEKAIDIKDEYYLGLIHDRASKKITAIFSTEGGIDIEQVAAKTPEKVIKVQVGIHSGMKPFIVRRLVFESGLKGEAGKGLAGFCASLFDAFVGEDATLAEINPLVRLGSGEFIAADSKFLIDDNALFRNPKFATVAEAAEKGTDEWEAKQNGLSYVGLDGDIGCIVNGAGLAMATMDMVKRAGGSPANFLDIGGSSSPSKVVKAMEIIGRNKKVKAILFNIFGGITRCDDVAKGLVEALDKVEVKLPIVIRLSGTNSEQGREIISKTDLITAETIDEAMEKVVKVAGGK